MRDDPARIAFILAGLGAGGAERVISLIARDQVDRGRDVTIIALDCPDDPIYHPLDRRIRLIRLGLPPRAGSITTSLRRTWALRNRLKQERPDLVVSFLTKINALTLIAAKGLGIPVIVSERNNPARQNAHPVWNRLLSHLYLRADAIVMQTRASLACLPTSVQSRAVVIPNPIPAALPSRQAGKVPTLSATGRLTHQKGFDLLIHAFSNIAAEFPEWRLVIWGEGNERPALENLIRTKSLENQVFLPGQTEKPGEWVQESSAFVLASRFEGFPNVLGEAMAAGLPIIAFDCPFGPLEMITHNMDGLLVPAEDTDALAHSMRRLMRDPDLRVRLGMAARENIRKFNPEKVMTLWNTTFNRALSGTTNQTQNKIALHFKLSKDISQDIRAD